MNAIKELELRIEKHQKVVAQELAMDIRNYTPSELAAKTAHILQIALSEDLPLTRCCCMLGRLVQPGNNNSEHDFRIGWALLYELDKMEKVEFIRQSQRKQFTRLDSTKLFKLYKDSKGRGKKEGGDRTNKIIEVIDEEWIYDLINGVELADLGNIKTLPLKNRPLEWTDFTHPHFGDLIPKCNRRVRRQINDRKQPELFKGINKVQNQGFYINSDVLSVVKACRYDDMFVGDGDELSLAGKRMELTATIKLAEEFEGDVFWLALQLGFRSRGYYSPSYLNPGGTDTAKGLIMAPEYDHQPLGQYGWDNLLAGLANSMGHDKLVKQAKLDLVDAMLDEVIMIGSEPLKHKQWQQWDEPVQGLSIAIEIAKAVASGDEYNYKCGIFIGRDASNSGPMLMGIATQDAQTLRVTNNTDDHNRYDSYLIVGMTAWKKFRYTEEEYQIYETIDKWLSELSEEEMVKFFNGYYRPFEKVLKIHAKVYLAQISDRKDIRKLSKRPTMIIGYAAQEWCIAEAIWDDHASKYGLNPVMCKTLADAIYEAYGEELPGCMQVMKGFKKLAGKACKMDMDYGFIVPYTNFPMMQNYYKTEKKTIRVKYRDKRIKAVLQIPTDKRNSTKAMFGAAPNTVHPWDAALLWMIVNSFNGPIRVNHDAFYAIPSQLDELDFVLRDCTYKLGTEYNLIGSVFEPYDGIEPSDVGITANKLSPEFNPYANNFNYQ